MSRKQSNAPAMVRPLLRVQRHLSLFDGWEMREYEIDGVYEDLLLERKILQARGRSKVHDDSVKIVQGVIQRGMRKTIALAPPQEKNGVQQLEEEEEEAPSQEQEANIQPAAPNPKRKASGSARQAPDGKRKKSTPAPEGKKKTRIATKRSPPARETTPESRRKISDAPASARSADAKSDLKQMFAAENEERQNAIPEGEAEIQQTDERQQSEQAVAPDASEALPSAGAVEKPRGETVKESIPADDLSPFRQDIIDERPPEELSNSGTHSASGGVQQAPSTERAGRPKRGEGKPKPNYI